MTPEERESIIQEALERMLLSIPGVIGNLMQSQAAYAKMNLQFYKDHPEFAQHKDVVAKVIEQVDGANPGEPYENKLAKAVPEITRRLKLMKGFNMKDVVSRDEVDRRTLVNNGDL